MNFCFKKSFSWKYLFLIAIFFALFFISKNASAAIITWDGGGTTNNWSEAANWSGNVVPGSNDDVIFNNTSLKNSVWDSAGPAQIISLNVQSNYSGILALGRNVSVSGDWTFSGSGNLSAQTSTLKFVSGSNQNFTAGPNSYYTIEMAKTANDLAIVGQATTVNFNISGSGRYINSGTLNVTGNMFITGTSTGGGAGIGGGTGAININGTGDQNISSPGSWTLPNITINKPSGTLYLSGIISIGNSWTWQAGSLNSQTSTLKFVGRYTNQNFIAGPNSYYTIEIASNGAITIQGQAVTANLIVSNAPESTVSGIDSGTLNITSNITITASAGGGGTGAININGTEDQNISSSGSWTLPNITINKPSGTLYLSGTVSVIGDWTWQSGVINAQTSTLKFIGGGTTRNFTSGPYSYYAIEIAKTRGGLAIQGQATTTNFIASANSQPGIDSGALNVTGNITITASSTLGGGTGAININGTGDQNISSLGLWALSRVIINKPSGTLYLSGTISVVDWTWQSGVINAQTSTLKFTGGQFAAGPYSYHTIEVSNTYSGFTIIGQATTTNLVNNGTVIGGIGGGTLNVLGNITIAATDFGAGNSNGTININGAGNQTFSSAGGPLPNVTINKPSGTLYLSGTVSVMGNWTWQSGVINAQTSTLKFTGAPDIDFRGGSGNSYYNIVIQKSQVHSYAVRQLSDININNNLDIISGYLIQNNYNLQVDNAITINQNGTWENYSTGTSYIYVGSGGVTNNGFIDFNGNGLNCSESDSILIRSTVAPARRSWSGGGSFRMQDVDVKDQGGTVSIVVAQGTNSGNNASNWVFDNNPLTYIYKANLTSSVFDTGIVEGANLNTLRWDGVGYTGNWATNYYVKFQFAVSSSSSGPWSFKGPDGTNSTYYYGYLSSYRGFSAILNPNFHKGRYFRYKVFLETDICRSVSPRVDNVIIHWAP